MKGLRFYFPLIALVTVAFALTIYISFIEQTDCAVIFNTSVSLLALLELCFLLPAIVFITSLYFCYFSYASSSGEDQFPPKSVPWPKKLKVLKGRRAKLAKVSGYLFPLFALAIVWLGVSTFSAISEGLSIPELNTQIIKQC
ncbi:hypothetical protein KS2013_1656 [Kangiella sediminilitoris]|uniref:Uncharacterized protein n=1 Tax=Kangiella sediminilitoris TaxID=1144748 RepID=A0A1B3BC30_9GAMM|nr:hypothetical protein KS2013_1656 [Kangiella sediminilitoris]